MSLIKDIALEFSHPLANAKDYPAAEFTFDPRPSGSNSGINLKSLRQEETFSEPPVFLRARYSLACIAASVLNKGARVLLPAYHCPAMIEPFIWAGCSLEFYDVEASTLLPAPAIELQLPSADAVLLSHFCFPRPALKVFAEQARKLGLLVIEDMAHAAHQPFLLGDIGVTSLVKFFPIPWGSEVLCKDNSILEAIRSKRHEMEKSSLHWGIADLWRRSTKRLLGRRHTSNSFRYFDTHTMSKPLKFSGHSSIVAEAFGDAAVARRENFHSLNQFFADRDPARSIPPEALGDGVPYAYPLLLSDESEFAALKNRRIPLQRWEELAPSTYKDAELLRRRLVQLPVHQHLTPTNLKLMIDALDAVLQKAG